MDARESGIIQEAVIFKFLEKCASTWAREAYRSAGAPIITVTPNLIASMRLRCPTSQIRRAAFWRRLDLLG